MERSSWALGLALIAVCIAIHAMGVVILALTMVRVRNQLERQHSGLLHVIVCVIGVVGFVGLVLATLHMFEAAIWAAAYCWVDALGSYADAMLYSVDTMSTRGASGLVLQERWRMMGALEASGGMLLFGISTAYIFAVMQVYWPLLYPAVHSKPST